MKLCVVLLLESCHHHVLPPTSHHLAVRPPTAVGSRTSRDDGVRSPPPSLLITTEKVLCSALLICLHHNKISFSPPISPAPSTRRAPPFCCLGQRSRNNHSIKSNRLHQPPPHQSTVASGPLSHLISKSHHIQRAGNTELLDVGATDY